MKKGPGIPNIKQELPAAPLLIISDSLTGIQILII
jgi:hypothetical protein